MNQAIDPLVRLENTLPHLTTAVSQQHLGKALNGAVAACTDVPQKIERLKSLANTYVLLVEYLPQRAADIQGATDNILDLGETMENVSKIVDLESIERDVKRLDAALSTLHRSAMVMTENYVREHVAPLSALERLLRRLGGNDVANAISELHQKASRLEFASISLPEKLTEVKNARQSLASDLTRLASDPEVDAFLTGFATKGSVPLSLVTKNVIDWLGEQAALEQFTVQPVD